MRILVTGALGFIGRASMSRLLAYGHEVRCVDRKPDPKMWSGNIWMDLYKQPDRVAAMFKANHFDAVLHLAANASLQKSVEDPIFDLHSNVEVTLLLLELCKQHDVRRFVFSSTSAVYRRQAPLPITEGPENVGPIVAYGVSKAAAEMYIRASGIPYAILRYGNVYGPGQAAVGENCIVPRALDFFVHRQAFQINGDGENRRDFVYIDDVAEANLLALQASVNGTFNIASGTSASVNEVVDILRASVGSELVPPHGPAKPGELREVVLAARRAKLHLGWTSMTSLESGLSATAATYLHG